MRYSLESLHVRAYRRRRRGADAHRRADYPATLVDIPFDDLRRQMHQNVLLGVQQLEPVGEVGPVELRHALRGRVVKGELESDVSVLKAPAVARRARHLKLHLLLVLAHVGVREHAITETLVLGYADGERAECAVELARRTGH